MLTCTMAGCHNSGKINYPEAPQDGTVDTIFGMEVSDIYRPLENDTAPATLAWVEAENKVTQDYLSQIMTDLRIRRSFIVPTILCRQSAKSSLTPTLSVTTAPWLSQAFPNRRMASTQPIP